MRCSKCNSKEIRKKGKVKTKKKGEAVQRFQCKDCGFYFTSRSHLSTHREKRPELNDKILSLYVEGNTLRGIARILGCSYTTVVRKFKKLSCVEQIKSLKDLVTNKNQVQYNSI